MTRRRTAIAWTTILAAVPGLLGAWIQVDRWRIERRQMVAQMTFQAEVAECESAGGRWWRGDCVDAQR